MATLCGVGACVDLLDVPDDPRLVEAANAPVGEAGATVGVGQGGGGGGPNGTGAASEQIPDDPPVSSNGGGASLSDATDTAAPDAAPVDGGPSDADTDAATEAGLRPDAESAPCGVGERLGPNGNCFAFITTLLDWESARQGCRTRAQGWDLAAGRSPEVNGFMAGLSGEEGWIGASDASTEGAWLWIRDGAPFWNGDGLTGNVVDGAYENWSSDEPNGEDSSDCARLVPASAGAWGDLECEELRGSFCEGPAR
jgi:hypothetical protein